MSKARLDAFRLSNKKLFERRPLMKQLKCSICRKREVFPASMPLDSFICQKCHDEGLDNG